MHCGHNNFFAGDKLETCIKNIPGNFKILIIDNGGEKNKKEYFEKKKIIEEMDKNH